MKFIGTAVAATGPIGLLIGAAALLTAAWVMWGDDIKAAVGSAIDFLSEKFQAFLDFLQKIVDKAREIKDAVVDAFTMGRSGVAPGGFDGSLGSIETGSYPEIGQNGAQGLLGGFGQGITDGEAELRAYIDRIPEIAREQLEIQSPSRVFHDIGEQIGTGLAEGIISTQALVAEATAAIGQQAEMTAGKFASSILGSMKIMFDRSKPIAAAQALVNTFLGVSEAIKLPFPANLAAAAKVAAQGFAAVRGIKSASIGGGGGGSRAAASGGSAAAAPAPMPLQATLNLQGPFASALQGALDPLLDGLNRAAGDRGYQLLARAR
jgi:phage-related protein